MRLSLMLVFLTAAPALAEEPRPNVPLAELYPPLPGVEYYCTDNTGARIELGDVMCFTASCQTWMARCEMTASNRMAMWRKIQDGCPGAEAGTMTGLEAVKDTL